MTTKKGTAKKDIVEVKPESEQLSRSPEIIAAEIRSIDQQARQYVLQSAIEIGSRLVEAKELVAHGEWGDWLKANVNYSQSTANNFMRVSAEYTNSHALANLSYTQAVALLAVPADERVTFVEENQASEMSTRELQAAIKEKQETERLLAEERERLKAVELEKEEETKLREELHAQMQAELEERQRLESELAEAQASAAKAESDKPDAKTKSELRKAEKALSESQKRLADLESEAKRHEEELNARIDAAVKEREKELAEQARQREVESDKKVSDLEEQLRKNNNTAAIKVKVHFDSLIGTFNELVSSLSSLDNEEQKQSISTRISQMLDEMKGKL